MHFNWQCKYVQFKKGKVTSTKYNLLKDVNENYTMSYCKKDCKEIISQKINREIVFEYLKNFDKKERLSIKSCMYSF